MPEEWTKSTPDSRATSVNRNGLGSCKGVGLTGVGTPPARRSPSRAGLAGVAGPSAIADVAAGGDGSPRGSDVAIVEPRSQPARDRQRAEATPSQAIAGPEAHRGPFRV